ncbi:tRNA maturation protein LHP1 KNAG_0D04260 [Huiozyma naganishii CBS 8797]|uniref:HTH La-type RNA-binding domain-containing protein n=1 Tax=Huiozyma naganishii (strain ATCC MYA-139 / BCRC 22969 / CBS 8797 / KCTC 17520 / NBRC 10181 / NCYC 3082 / Yp74L-3) TaxID=1071383 RepID=J7RYE0_HUIN7|nr:hypothetical protein KNAG_0D04260 [Kazachstania naganishii CBS 8797]CCK70172.1 hypothetical protein KNAG_0D04260 [Kazachstania naganishii CBS 8797]
MSSTETPENVQPKDVATSRRGSFVPVEFTPENSKQCLKQVEFYFSEFNFPYDKFLRTTAEKNDGWVPIGTIATFNRMKKFRPIDKLVEILRDSALLEVSEDGENVKRRVPLDSTKSTGDRVEQSKRTVVVMNIPHTPETIISELQEKVEDFFQKVENVAQVRLKRDRRRRFHGIAMVEFATAEDCEKFVENYSCGSDDKSKDILSFEGRKLDILTKKQYDQQREATRSKNFSGSGQRSRSFTGHRKNMPKLEAPPAGTNDESAVAEEKEEETKPEN